MNGLLHAASGRNACLFLIALVCCACRPRVPSSTETAAQGVAENHCGAAAVACASSARRERSAGATPLTRQAFDDLGGNHGDAKTR